MSPSSTGWCWRRKVLLLFLFLSVGTLGLAKTKRGNDSDISNIIRPGLLNAQIDPTLRFPIMRAGGSVFSITFGWLDISNSTVRYTVVQPASKSSHSFEVSRFAISDLRFKEWLTFRAPKKAEMLIYLPQDRWGSVHSGPGMGAAANRESLGTQSIYKTLLNFDGVLALVKPPAPPPAPVIVQAAAPVPPPKPAAPPSPPAIVLSSPPGAGENQTLEWAESTVVIRGAAMDSTGIPVVSINGSPANMRPQNTRAAEFWSDPLPLQPGANPIQITASNSAHVETNLALTVLYRPKSAPDKPKPALVNPRALDRLEIVGLLQGGVPPARVMDLVKERGIKFSPSEDDLNALRAAGATDELIDVIEQVAPHP